MEFTTKADLWDKDHDFELCTITIESRDGKIFVNSKEAKMTYNGIQLRFQLLEKNKGSDVIYIILDDAEIAPKTHSPPKPIAEMYKELGGK